MGSDTLRGSLEKKVKLVRSSYGAGLNDGVIPSQTQDGTVSSPEPPEPKEPSDRRYECHHRNHRNHWNRRYECHHRNHRNHRTNGTSVTTGTIGTNGTIGPTVRVSSSEPSEPSDQRYELHHRNHRNHRTNGTSVTIGTIGTNGTSVITGTIGTDGTSFITGTIGTDGTSFITGTTETIGTDGTSVITGGTGTIGPTIFDGGLICDTHEMAPCGSKCAKYTLFTFNFVLFVSGLAVLGIGIWILVDKSNFVTLTARLSDVNGDLGRYGTADSVLQQTAYLFIASGIITLFVAFLGCCGAIKEWRPLLITYAVLLLLILGLEIAAGIYAGVFRNTANDYVLTTMQTTLRRQYTHDGMFDNGTHIFVTQNVNFWTKAWDQMMVTLRCCGVNSGQDFLPPDPTRPFVTNLILEAYRPQIPGPPLSCCAVVNPDYVPAQLVPPSLNDIPCSISRSRGATNAAQGCFPRLMAWLDQNLQIMTGVGIGIGLVQIFGIVFSLCLCMAIKSEK
ncbi:putative CD151 antigen [Hypsibius exemplaris]|uniref:CD151 antigen n=1 Tax=Hypsibius exemplaris TaxID=2072580 RepID=A0A1W0WGU9_HYPEX|nr:putative CD151 antigen [Hypsibius exemplaris]